MKLRRKSRVHPDLIKSVAEFDKKLMTVREVYCMKNNITSEEFDDLYWLDDLEDIWKLMNVPRGAYEDGVRET